MTLPNTVPEGCELVREEMWYIDTKTGVLFKHGKTYNEDAILEAQKFDRVTLTVFREARRIFNVIKNISDRNEDQRMSAALKAIDDLKDEGHPFIYITKRLLRIEEIYIWDKNKERTFIGLLQKYSLEQVYPSITTSYQKVYNSTRQRLKEINQKKSLL